MSGAANEPIAIIGSACRLAGEAHSPSKLWDVLRAPPDLRREIPQSRFHVDGFYHPQGDHHGHSNVRHSYLLSSGDEVMDVAAFDAEFFGIRAVEAKSMDPQQRFLLEVVYEGMESAGLALETMRGSDTGVYAGLMFDDYAAMQMRDLDALPTYVSTGTGRSILSNRISYVFDWHGPSMTIDTACSSSLVAMHTAVQALRAGECHAAVACGSNLLLSPESYIIESNLSMLSPHGYGKMWDQSADGYARGEGVAAVVLKTLSQALADGDHVECLVRETGLNQDGATTGITLPSADAQQALIRRTYARAGLDLGRAENRPQFFEAHGTGTPAGDPIEAEAIHRAFFGGQAAPPQQPLYVGSIKTVVGHTEGTAGVAAILKASLALQHAAVPPNLLLSQLSDRVAPFYQHVEIPLALQPWPAVPAGQPRRASVNNFGFGGTNAHVILESYAGDQANRAADSSATLFAPFVFSAFSDTSLRASLAAYAAYLAKSSAGVLSVHDLAWTLRKRRSVLPYRLALAAHSAEDLRTQIEEKLRGAEAAKAGLGIRAHPASRKGASKILGIFTGQGAQYARMGAELVEKSAAARRIIEQLEQDLAELPDGPAWSLLAELTADASTTRVYEAAISQPLCTAVQILLVDMLQQHAGIALQAVVGHSSGEIAAVYAAGYLTARDAIRIAYYRGLHLALAASPNGVDIPGAMMAVGTSMDDMLELCQDDAFRGRVSVAASNAPASVTVSGDADAVRAMQVVLEDENKFHRLLRVDKAYHSQHMLPCSDPYMESLRRCGVQARSPDASRPACAWFSSVYGTQADDSLPLSDTYWAENLTRPVLFSQALQAAVGHVTFDMVLEIGPHPALQGPALQTIQDAVPGREVPYHGVLRRGNDAVQATSTALGFLWSHLEPKAVDLDGFEQAMSPERQHTVLKDLPTYAWNHETRYWQESRVSQKMQQRSQPTNPLLGDVSPDSAPPFAMRWKNVLLLTEMEWLMGHRVQSQTVFPAAGYVVTALEAARSLASTLEADQSIRLIELRNLEIHQAVVFDQDDDGGIEVLTAVDEIVRESKAKIRGSFTYLAATGPPLARDLTLAASCIIEISLGEKEEPSKTLLPRRGPAQPHMIDVEPERFYASLADLGYNFAGMFRSLNSMRRRHGKASALVQMLPADERQEQSLLIHPAELDAAFQSVMLAYSYPDDCLLNSLHLPTAMRHIRVDPSVLLRRTGASMAVDSLVDLAGRRSAAPDQRGITGAVALYCTDDAAVEPTQAAIQVQGARFVPLQAEAPATEDRRLFSKVHWVDSSADGERAADGVAVTERHHEAANVLERISTFFLRQFDRDVAADHPMRSQFPTNWYLNFARHIAQLVDGGQHPMEAGQGWRNDTLEDVRAAAAAFADSPDVRIMMLVGEQMPAVFRGEANMLEQFRASDILDRYYADGFGLRESAQWLGNTVRQIAHRYPHLNIMEIGAGTGGATKAIFRAIGDRFQSYTYTDISAAFFDRASSVFAAQRDRMLFKTFDAEKDLAEQGYAEHSYDMVVAFFIIHATSSLENSLRHIRKLLRPGGFLVVGEGTQDDLNSVASSGFIFGTLPGWWLGASDASGPRELSPLVSTPVWDRLLRRTGFSGVDSQPPPAFERTFNVSLFVSQAVDERIDFLRHPLQHLLPSLCPRIGRLVLLGGQTPHTARLVQTMAQLLEPTAAEILCFSSLADAAYHRLEDVPDTAVLGVTELDAPVFRDITPDAFAGLRKIFESEKTLLWVTSGRLADQPFSNMTIGFGRSAANEMPGLRLQQLDVADPRTADPALLAEALLRLHSRGPTLDAVLWSVEPEIVIDADGRQKLSRLIPIPTANDRYNSTRRQIVHEATLQDLPVSVTPRQDKAGYSVTPLSHYDVRLDSHVTRTSTLRLRTTHASSLAVQTPLGPKFLVLGTEEETGDAYLALVPSLASVLAVPAVAAVPCRQPHVNNTLPRVAAQLVAMSLVDPLFAGQLLLVHNAPSTVAHALRVQAAAKKVHVVFVVDADKQTTESADDSLVLPSFVAESEVQGLLPIRPSSFAGFTVSQTATDTENEATILSTLPNHCRVATMSTLFSTSGCETDHRSSGSLGELVRQVLACAQPGLSALAQENAGTTSLDRVARGEQTAVDPWSVLDFAITTPLPVHMTRLDASPLFRSDKTYWVVGLSGALGLSLSDWMVSRGARTLVLTSRRPVVAPEWLAAHQRSGAHVVIMPCDVTNEPGLQAVHRQICETLPPIVGVMNGAMVLRDTSVPNMSYEQLMDVVRPKVHGSIYLDRIFFDTPLDFFVLISSINCVIGNVGQANYAAANTFMCSLAAQRRKRGLRSTAVNVGAIIGAGYMEREGRRALDLIVQKTALMHLSEEDWHQIIAEAIDACQTDNGPELTTGLLDVPIDSPNAPHWYLNPKFSAFLVRRHAGQDGVVGADAAFDAQQSVQDLLRACQTEQEVHEVVKAAYAAQLRKMLQIDVPDDELMAMQSNELGLDSLVSVDIRAWFLKSLQVSVPVLKIMGHGNMAGLVQYAVQNVLPTIAVSSGSDQSPGGNTDSTPRSSTRDESEVASSRPSDTEDGIDWDEEFRLPAGIEQGPVPPLASQTPNVILLTGVTGLLGHHLLEYLLANTTARKIICPAVRNLQTRKDMQQQQQQANGRVVFYDGDLSQPRLGLSEEDVQAIFAEVDVVIHNGADTSHLKNYVDVRASNVGSTQFLLRMCVPRRVPFHYVSSAGVAIYSGLDPFPPVSASSAAQATQPPSSGALGYACSKWVCERLLEQAVAEYPSLPVVIHRPSTILREGDDAVGTRAELDWVNALMYWSREISAVPRVEQNSGALDLVSVRSCCEAIVGSVLEYAGAEGGVQYVHEVGDKVIPMYELGQHLGGEKLRSLPMEEWVVEAKQAGLHPAVAALVEELDAIGTSSWPSFSKN